MTKYSFNCKKFLWRPYLKVIKVKKSTNNNNNFFRAFRSRKHRIYVIESMEKKMQ